MTEQERRTGEQQQQQQDERTAEKEEEEEAPDGGWGWVVAAGVFLVALVIPMLAPSFAILFSRQLLERGTSSTAVAVLFNGFMTTWKVTGVLLGMLTREWGFRRVAMTGTALTASCLTLSAFVTSTRLLFLFFSVGCGVGCGLSCVGYLILAQYFKKLRGRANTCLMAGASLGHFSSPILIRFLQDQYGLQGAIFIMGAAILHGVLGACVFHPVEWHRRKWRQKHTACRNIEAASALLSGIADGKERERDREGGRDGATVRRLSYDVTKNGDTANEVFGEENGGAVGSSPTEIRPKDDVLSYSTSIKLSSERCCSAVRGCWRTVKRVVFSIAADLRILRHPSCLIIALASTLVTSVDANFTVMVPFAIQATGSNLQEAAWCISIAGICNFVTRMCVSPLSDQSWFNMKLCYMLGMATMFVAIIAFSVVGGAWGQAGVMGAWGCGLGCFSGLNNLLMTRIVGLQQLGSIYSARNFLGSLSFLTIGPLFGLVRDVSGSYSVTMWVLAGLVLLSLVLWLLMPSALAYDARNRARHLHDPQHHATTN